VTQRPVTIARRLAEAGVRFVVIGGVAENLHGSARVTFDCDVVYDPAPDNQLRLIATLRDWGAWLRGAPDNLPFVLDGRTLGINPVLTLSTKLGDLDVMDRVAGVGDYATVLARSKETLFEGTPLRVLELDALIASKRATGRVKDIGPAKELAALYVKLHGREPPRVKEPTRRPRRSRGRGRA